MKFISSILFALMLAFSAPSTANAKASIGGIAGSPEYVGLAASYFPVNAVSLDGWLTLSTIDGGVTLHLPVDEDFRDRHSILLTGMGGYAHNLINTFPKSQYHALIAGGYGYQSASGWDLRGQLGAEIYGTDPVAAQFHGHVYVGHQF